MPIQFQPYVTSVVTLPYRSMAFTVVIFLILSRERLLTDADLVSGDRKIKRSNELASDVP